MSQLERRMKALLAAIALCMLAATTAASADPACPDPVATTDPQPVTVTAPKATLSVRVADTAATREYGLMCVRELPPHTGMVFVFDDGDIRRSFWMKNTLIPLDMVYVRKNGVVSTVAANVPATTVTTPDADVPFRYGIGTFVIELGAGEAARDGIVPGAHLDLSHVGKAKN